MPIPPIRFREVGALQRQSKLRSPELAPYCPLIYRHEYTGSVAVDLGVDSIVDRGGWVARSQPSSRGD
jgi:hypothetical protein